MDEKSKAYYFIFLTVQKVSVIIWLLIASVSNSWLYRHRSQMNFPYTLASSLERLCFIVALYIRITQKKRINRQHPRRKHSYSKPDNQTPK